MILKSKLIFIFTFWVVSLTAQNGNFSAFKTGEELTYRVFYSSPIIDATAGEAKLVIKKDSLFIPYKNSKEEVLHITGSGSSKGLFDFFYTVRDTFETYVNRKTLLPYRFIRATHEGNFKRHDRVWFNRDSLTAETSRKIISIPADVHDMISAIYYMRLLNIDNYADKDSMYIINFYLDDSVYYSAVKFLGRDTVKTSLGYIPSIKIAPMMATGEVFAKKYPMFVWVTDDKNHIPVLVSSEVIVGSVKMELIKYKNLKNTLVKISGKRRRKN